MAKEIQGSHGRRGSPWRIAGWGMAGLLLLLPLLAMQFTEEVNWSLGDFIFIAILIGIVGLTFELVVRMTNSWFYRGGIVFALAGSALIIVATGAVGMIGEEGDPYNLYFFGVIALALAGAITARFRAAGMAVAMATAGIVQIAISIVGMSIDPRGGVVSGGFAGLWLISAVSFWKAARRPAGRTRSG